MSVPLQRIISGKNFLVLISNSVAFLWKMNIVRPGRRLTLISTTTFEGKKWIIFSFVGILTRLFQDRAVKSDTDTIFWLSTDGEHRTMLSHIELYRYMNLDERWNFRETGNLVSRFEWLRWLDVRKSSEWDPPGVFRLILISNWLW